MATPTEVRNLYKAFHDKPDFHAQVRAATSVKEKHAIIRNAGYVPATDKEVQAELAKSLQSGTPVTPEDQAFVGHVVTLAAADTSQANDS